MQNEEVACLPVGTEVSAKYKGAFCEAKVKKVHRQVKCRITFKQGLGSFTLCDSLIKGNISSGASVQARHPEKSIYLDAVVNKIQDQSHYTVVFDDGDIATLRRNALCMKSGKHFNASESLDNLPLTHPEHFGTPVGGRRRGRVEEEEESSSEDEETNQPYLGNIGRVVCVEVTDKKQTKTKENWFPGLVVAPNAQEIVKINTKEDFLVRSFKDHRYYTVPKKECKKFHRESFKVTSENALQKAVEHALAFLDRDVLPPHWDREILFDMREETSTEGSSEEEYVDSGDDDTESREEKDHLVAELYKHMDDRGTPINRTPSIGTSDVDLYRLFKLVQRLGGQNRVTANNQWRQVAKKLGFETNWCVNQVRVCYNRYLHSFEELYRTLGCTLVNHPRGSLSRIRHGSGRPLARGIRVKSKDEEERRDEDSSDQSSISSQDSEIKDKQEAGVKDEISDEIIVPKKDGRGRKKGAKKEIKEETHAQKEGFPDVETEVVGRKKGKSHHGREKGPTVFTRPRRDSSSSLSTASEVKVKKEEPVKKKKSETTTTAAAAAATAAQEKKKFKDLKELDDIEDSDSSYKGGRGRKGKRLKEDDLDEDVGSDLDSATVKKKKVFKKKIVKTETTVVEPVAQQEPSEEEPQHLKNNVICNIGDKIKVFWLHGQIYEAKILKTDANTGEKWPKFYVHYLGWNSRYDEWVTRGRIAENTSWNNSHKSRGSSVKSVNSPKGSKLKRSKEAEDKSDLDVKTEDESEEAEEKEIKQEKKINQETKKDETEAKKKYKAKGKSLTPSSTPNSSRTNSPAGSSRTVKSPTKQASPAKDSKDDRSSSKDEDESDLDREPPPGLPVKRTNSPVTRKSTSTLKRQNSASNRSAEEEAKPGEKEKPRKKDAKSTKKEEKNATARAEEADKLKHVAVTIKEEKVEVKVEKSEAADDDEEEEELVQPVRKSSRNGKGDDSPNLTLSKRRPGTPETAKKSGSSVSQLQTVQSDVKASTSTESLTSSSVLSSSHRKPASPEVKPVLGGAETTRSSARLESRRPATPSSESKSSVGGGGGGRGSTPSKKSFASSSSSTKDLDDPYDFKEAEDPPLKFEAGKTVSEQTLSSSSSSSPLKSAEVKTATKPTEECSYKASIQATVDSLIKSGVKAMTDDTVIKSEPDEATTATTTTTAAAKETEEKRVGRGRKKKPAVVDVKVEAEEQVEQKEAAEAGEANEQFKDASDVKTEATIVPKREANESMILDEKVEKTRASSSVVSSAVSSASSLLPKSIHPLPNRYALFPHLASLSAAASGRPTHTLPPVAPSLPPAAPPITLPSILTAATVEIPSKVSVATTAGVASSAVVVGGSSGQPEKYHRPVVLTSETIMNTIVGNVLEETFEKAEKQLKMEKSESEDAELKMYFNFDTSSNKNSSSPSPREKRDNSKEQSPRKCRKKPKIRGPRNNNLKSREVVTDSDSDSSENSRKSRLDLGAKRRKTTESEKISETNIKAEPQDEEKSLVCRETIDRSPDRSFDEVPGRRDRRIKREELDLTQAGRPGKTLSPETPKYLQTVKLEVKSPDSSEVDLESLTGSPKRPGSDLESLTGGRHRGGSDVESLTGTNRAGSEDSRLEHEYSSSSETRSGRGKRKRLAAEKSPVSLKRKRKSRDSVGRGRGKGRGRLPSTAVGGISAVRAAVAAAADETEDSEPPMIGTRSRTDLEMAKLERLDNAALAALAQPKPNTTSKYNFYVKLEPSMDSVSRISALQSTLEDLRKTYNNIKTDLNALDRRRKKMRKKEKERNHHRSNQSELAVS